MMFTACDPAVDEIQPAANVTVEDLTNSFQLVARSEGNNNISVALDPVRYVKVYNADTDALLCEGTNPSFQDVPPAKTLNVYVTVINQDGSITKSDAKSIESSSRCLAMKTVNMARLLGRGMTTPTMLLAVIGAMVVGEVTPIPVGGVLLTKLALTNNVQARECPMTVLALGSL